MQGGIAFLCDAAVKGVIEVFILLAALGHFGQAIQGVIGVGGLGVITFPKFQFQERQVVQAVHPIGK